MTWFTKLPDSVKSLSAASLALAGAFALGGAFSLMVFVGDVPAQIEAANLTNERQDAAIRTLQSQSAQMRGMVDYLMQVEIRFLSCTEVARQQRRDDPGCLQEYVQSRRSFP